MKSVIARAETNNESSVLQSKANVIGHGMKIGISSFGAWMLGVGSIIGSMAWLFHGLMIAQAGPLATLTAWVIASLMAFPLALILAELSSIFPTAGGPYVYKYYALKRLIPGMREPFGFLTGWLFWIYLIVGYACMSNGLANLLSSSFWGESGASPIWFGPLVILGLFLSTTVMNSLEVSSATQLNNLFTLMKFALALGFGALVAFSPTTSLSHVLQINNTAGGHNFYANIATVITFALAGFAGIEMAGCTASETKNASKSVPRAIILTLFTVALIYLSMSLAVSCASTYVLSTDGTTLVVPGTNIQANCPALAGYLGGKTWGSITTILVVVSIVGCSFSGLLGCARLGYSMSETGLFPTQFSRLNPRSKVPTYALWFQFFCLLAIGVGANLLARSKLFLDAYSFLGAVCGFLYAVLALLYGVCLLSLRYTDPTLARPFRLGKQGNMLAWVVCLGAIAVYGFVAFACTHWSHQVAGLFFLMCGLPIYWFYRGRTMRSN